MITLDGIKTLIGAFKDRITMPQYGRLEKIIKEDIKADGGKKRQPGRLSLYIKDTGEKALQRALYLSSRNSLFFDDKTTRVVLWGDAEVPVSIYGKLPRGSCFDLVGRDITGNYIFCELKSGKSNDSPLFAALELLAYTAVFYRYKVLSFHENSIAKISGWKIAPPTLVIAGDAPYWDKWDKRTDYRASLQQLQQKHCLFFFSIPVSSKVFFQKQQRRKSAAYTPCLGGICEWREKPMRRA